MNPRLVTWHPQFADRIWTTAMLLLAFAAGDWGARAATGQTPKTDRPKPSRKEATPKVEEVTLTTRDGVVLRCTYYPGPESKKTVPMILVHDWNESRGALHGVAQWMQQALQVSVIVPDLRGHGHSLRAQGWNVPIDREKLKGPAIDAAMLDIEACKSFLLRHNNEGKVNIEQLGIAGSGFGALLAFKWAVADWSVPDLPSLKQGRDVKGLILVSPLRSHKGCTINQELKNLRVLSFISTLVLVGKQDARRLGDAQRIHKTFERAWGEHAKAAAPFFAVDTSLQGTELLTAPETGIDEWLKAFIQLRLVQQGERFPWTDRTSPLQ